LKFKIDENLPHEYALLLRATGFAADTVDDEGMAGADDSAVAERSRIEERVLMTLDLDFANIQAYPPGYYFGILVFRSKAQDKITLLTLLRRLIPILLSRSPERQLWIVEHDRIRFREG
jgi:predicted nuclease of predicted toxin-antitoxin system